MQLALHSYSQCTYMFLHIQYLYIYVLHISVHICFTYKCTYMFYVCCTENPSELIIGVALILNRAEKAAVGITANATNVALVCNVHTQN